MIGCYTVKNFPVVNKQKKATTTKNSVNYQQSVFYIHRPKVVQGWFSRLCSISHKIMKAMKPPLHQPTQTRNINWQKIHLKRSMWILEYFCEYTSFRNQPVLHVFWFFCLISDWDDNLDPLILVQRFPNSIVSVNVDLNFGVLEKYAE